MKNFKNIDWLSGRATIVPLSWLKAGLTGAEWDVGIYLLSVTTAKTDPKKNDIAGTCRASHETIAEKLGRNKMAIGRDVRSLIKKGCIKKVYQGSGKSKMSNVYKILDDLQDNELVVYKAEQGNELVALEPINNELVSNKQPTGSQQTTNSYSINNELVVPSVSYSESLAASISMSLEESLVEAATKKPEAETNTVLDEVVNSVESIAKPIDGPPLDYVWTKPSILYRGKPIPSVVVDALGGQVGRLEATSSVALDYDNADYEVIEWLMDTGVNVCPLEAAN